MYSSEKSNEETVSWVLDSLVGFLNGPVWNLPILNFIEQKSIVFELEEENETGNEMQDERDMEYAKIYEEFKHLVDQLLSGHMSDLGISPEQFDQACTQANGVLSSKFHAVLFEQIWAASNFRIFKRMMIKRNIDLQLQALEILAQREGIKSSSYISDSDRSETEHNTNNTNDCVANDEMLINTVIQRSLLEQRQLEALTEQERALKQALKDDHIKDENSEDGKHGAIVDQLLNTNTSRKLITRAGPFVKSAVSDIKTKIKEIAINTTNPTMISNISQTSTVSQENGTKNDPEKTKNHPEEAIPESSMTQIDENFEGYRELDMNILLSKPIDSITPEELKERQNYLRIQRDRLIELKRKEREKQAQKIGDSEMKAKRPKSARAICSLIKSNEQNDDLKKDVKLEDRQEINDTLAYRKSLAARLKAEVIDDSHGELVSKLDKATIN